MLFNRKVSTVAVATVIAFRREAISNPSTIRFRFFLKISYRLLSPIRFFFDLNCTGSHSVPVKSAHFLSLERAKRANGVQSHDVFRN